LLPGGPLRLSNILIGITATCLIAGVSAPAFALENRVTVESRTFYPGQEACTVGVFFENSVGLTAIVAPLEIRSIDSGAYPASDFWRRLNPNGRIWGSPMYWYCTTGFCPPLYLPLRTYAVPVTPSTCSGPLSHSWNAQAANIDYVSPDAFMLSVVAAGDPNIGDDITLDPGSDGFATLSASVQFGFTAGMSTGRFEIDTCCTLPMNHLVYVDSNTNAIHTEFTKGVITIACQCPCANDPNCDGVSTDILDVIETIQVAFSGKPTTTDPGCTRQRTDVDCNGVTNVVDAVRIALVSFAGFDRAVLYCDPCE
jgi:hypothetical protein